MIKFLNPLKALFAIVVAVAVLIGILYAVTGKSEAQAAQEDTLKRIMILENCFGQWDWLVFQFSSGLVIKHDIEVKDRATLKVLMQRYPVEVFRPNIKACM